MRSVSMLLSVLFGLALTVASAAAQGFEGTVRYRDLTLESDGLHRALGEAAIDDEGIEAEEVFAISLERIVQLAGQDEFLASVEEVTYQIKGKKLRLQSGEYFVIMDLEAGVIRMFQPEEKIFMELTLEQIEEINQQAAEYAGESESEAAEVRRLGETRTINGMRAVSYEVRSAEGLTRAWVSDEHKDLVETLRRIVGLAALEGEDTDSDAFSRLTEYGMPILVQTYDEDAQLYQVGEILAVEPGSISAGVFEVPAGYTKRTFPGMGG